MPHTLDAQPWQTTLDEGVPLREVEFCVVDLETTGGSPADAAITEVGAVRYRAGERIGVFHTLVDPRCPIPVSITHLTGIDGPCIAGAPTIEAVLPGLVEFLRGGVFVAHNARFDFAFLNAALDRLDYRSLDGPPVCTARLARRIVWPDVPNVRLHTLAQYFSTSVRPSHRALDDAQACAEVLHGLLELGGRLGILTLGDLRSSVTARGRPHFGKIRLADALPRAAGVYLFKGRGGDVLYVGKSKDLRTRVKSYFYGDARKKVGDLLSQTATVEGIPCETELEALVLEARLIRRHEPRYNRRGRTWRRYAYLRIDTTEAFPRIKVVREANGRGAFLGPFSTSADAKLAKEALEEAHPIRRCTTAMRYTTRFAPCVLADIGRCAAPCDGRATPERYEELVRELISSLSNPDELLEGLERRMGLLAAEERYEEAALARDRLRALAEGLARSRADRWLIDPGSLVLRVSNGSRVRFRRGSLVAPAVEPASEAEGLALPCPRHRADEVAAVRSWLARNPTTIEHADIAPAEGATGGSALHRILARCRASSRRDDGSPRNLDRTFAGGLPKGPG
jgi:DNA polymerase-3 subunit epsilon